MDLLLVRLTLISDLSEVTELSVGKLIKVSQLPFSFSCKMN